MPITFGILRDKEKNDLGMATSVIEHKASVSIEDVRKELAEMKQTAIDAETTEVSDEGK